MRILWSSNTKRKPQFLNSNHIAGTVLGTAGISFNKIIRVKWNSSHVSLTEFNFYLGPLFCWAAGTLSSSIWNSMPLSLGLCLHFQDWHVWVRKPGSGVISSPCWDLTKHPFFCVVLVFCPVRSVQVWPSQLIPDNLSTWPGWDVGNSASLLLSATWDHCPSSEKRRTMQVALKGTFRKQAEEKVLH